MGAMDTARKRIETIVGLVGLTAFLLLGRVIGGAGVAYMAAAVETCFLCLLPFGDNLSETLGRLLRRRLEKSQYKAAKKQYRNMLAFQSALGVILGLALFLLSDLLAGKILLVPYAGLLLKIAAPIIPIRAIQGVLAGGLMGNQRTSEVILGRMLRPILWIGFGLLFSRVLQAYGERVGALLHNVYMPSMYGAAGIVLGITLSELLLLVLLLLLGLGERKRSRTAWEEGLKNVESFRSNVSEVYAGVNLEMMYAFLRRLPLLLGIVFYQRNTGDIYQASAEYGAYYGGYLVLCGIVVWCIDLLTIPVCKKVAGSLRKEDGRRCREHMTGVFHIGLALALWAGVFLTIMAPQLAEVILKDYVESGSRMLRTGGALVLFGAMSMLHIRLLSYQEKYNAILVLMGIYVIGFVAGISVFFKTVTSDSLVLVYGGLTAVGILCAASGFLAFRTYKAALDGIRTILIPALLACVSGLSCLLIVRLLLPHLGAGVTLLTALTVSLALYWAALLFLNNFKSWELACLPGGRKKHSARRKDG